MNKGTLLVLAASPILLAGCSLLPGSTKTTGVSNQSTEVAQNTGAPTSSPATTPSALANGNYQEGISLSVSSPVDGSSVSSPTVTVTGKTAPGAEISVNDKDLAADVNGNFSATVDLDEGENAISVVANDRDGNSAEKDITVTYNAPGSSM